SGGLQLVDDRRVAGRPDLFELAPVVGLVRVDVVLHEALDFGQQLLPLGTELVRHPSPPCCGVSPESLSPPATRRNPRSAPCPLTTPILSTTRCGTPSPPITRRWPKAAAGPAATRPRC